jgi:hypothetical protein
MLPGRILQGTVILYHKAGYYKVLSYYENRLDTTRYYYIMPLGWFLRVTIILYYATRLVTTRYTRQDAIKYYLIMLLGRILPGTIILCH